MTSFSIIYIILYYIPSLPAARNYVKVSYGKYLLELDLVDDIDDTKMRAVSKAGVLLLKIKKVCRQL